MGRKLHYKPGSFYRQSDRTGFAVRAEETRMQWNNLITEDSTWEPRQPQDLVKGVKDIQGVPFPRPLPADEFVGPVYVQTTANAAVLATSLILQSVKGFRDGSTVRVMMDNGIEFQTTVDGNPTGLTIDLTTELPYSAASGNLVTLLRTNPGVDA